MKVESLNPIDAISKPFKSEKKKKSSRITNAQNTNEQATVGEHNINIVSADVLKKLKASGKVIAAHDSRAQKLLGMKMSSEKMMSNECVIPDSLKVGFPISFLKEQYMFGAVITKVTDKKSELLGSLKLTDLPPLHVQTVASSTQVIALDADCNPKLDEEGKPVVMTVPALALNGCGGECTERSKKGDLIKIPIDSVDEESGIVYLDLKTLGEGLDLMSIMDEGGEYTKLITVMAKTTEINYDLKTLLFDIKSTMVPKGTTAETLPTAPITEITVRWYLKLASGFDPMFESRSPTPGVGFFETTRAKSPKITRFSVPDDGSKIKYYIKNVPKEYREYFSGALDNWNKKFDEILKIKPLEYEFIEKEDSRHAQLVPGDVRFNIMEWDEDNRASYGGLGPSIANQFTGQTISANVLIQGPNIIEMYTKWFELSKDIRALRSAGQVAEANNVIKTFSAEASQMMKKFDQRKHVLSLGKNLEFRVNSQRPELQDPMIKNHFEVVPAGVTFKEYMKGYFTEMLEHELGHNLGLRHNFKGNLGATDAGVSGSASRSIMEYLGRPYRHMNEIGLYDEMAIKYGYTGEAPKRLNWFCTDEHQASSAKDIGLASPECSKSDATSDPFSFWESRVKRSLDLALDMKSASAPVWKVEEIKAQVEEFTIAFANYAAANEKVLDSLTNFFGKADRPEEKSKVKPYVLTKLKALICNPALADVIKAKESQEASKLAQDNLDGLRKVVADKSKELAVFTETELKCN